MRESCKNRRKARSWKAKVGKRGEESLGKRFEGEGYSLRGRNCSV